QPAIVRFQIPAPERARFASGLGLSPDGRRLAFVAIDDNNRPMLWVRALDSLEVRALPGTEGAAFPFWSPDTRFIGFHAPAEPTKSGAWGGPPQTICETTGIVTGGSWSREGTILYWHSEYRPFPGFASRRQFKSFYRARRHSRRNRTYAPLVPA